MALLDLWHPEKACNGFAALWSWAGEAAVYKMPHLEGWAVAG